MVETGKELLEKLASRMNPATTKGMSADFQFIFTGAETSAYYLRIANGACTVGQGELDYAQLTVRVDVDEWRKIQNGEVSWRDAMMQRKFIFSGKTPLLARLPEFFTFGA